MSEIRIREEAHKTIRLLIVVLAVVVSLFAQSFWVRASIQQAAEECPITLRECRVERNEELDACIQDNLTLRERVAEAINYKTSGLGRGLR